MKRIASIAAIAALSVPGVAEAQIPDAAIARYEGFVINFPAPNGSHLYSDVGRCHKNVCPMLVHIPHSDWVLYRLRVTRHAVRVLGARRYAANPWRRTIRISQPVGVPTFQVIR